jgi:predicted CXXCH cytochrome family protein
VVVFDGAGQSCSDPGTGAGTFFYAAFAYDVSSHYAGAARAVAMVGVSCEGCHSGDGYDPDGAGPMPAAPNVMGDGDSPAGTGGTPKPFDNGTWGFNVNGHGANGTAANTPKDLTLPYLSGNAPCVACHDIGIPAGTHLDGVLNSVELKLNPNQNTAHLRQEFIGGASPAWGVQLTFDDRCTLQCHSVALRHRHSHDGDPAAGAAQFGQKGSVTDGESIAYPIDSALSTNASTAAPDFAPCISCHNPHGTSTVTGGFPTNGMLRDVRDTQLCRACHQ